MDTQSTPEGISSLLDTDLYKLTMQCAVFGFFAVNEVAYELTNRTPEMKLTRGAYKWLQDQVHKLGNLAVTGDELLWLQQNCPYLRQTYLRYLQNFRLKPDEHVKMSFEPDAAGEDDSTPGKLSLSVRGPWCETILFEIPLLALISEAYFKFVDTDWSYDGQVENAKAKGLQLIENGCVFSEFGSRRRRDYRTHEMVMQGLVEAQKEAESNGKGWTGKLSGTSNVHLAMKFGVAPVGTVAHEWFMAIAALTRKYEDANQQALNFWMQTYPPGVLSIALTDTFGTPAFLKAFALHADLDHRPDVPKNSRYADVFTGVRQDSGDPLEFLEMMRKFYKKCGITDKKVIVFSDSLNVEKCIQYREATIKAGLTPSFGVGTFFTNDFTHVSTGEKSVPLNIVIKLSEADGRPAVKLSDNKGKNTGDSELVKKVKKLVGYEEHEWKDGDEAHRWDK